MLKQQKHNNLTVYMHSVDQNMYILCIFKPLSCAIMLVSSIVYFYGILTENATINCRNLQHSKAQQAVDPHLVRLSDKAV